MTMGLVKVGTPASRLIIVAFAIFVFHTCSSRYICVLYGNAILRWFQPFDSQLPNSKHLPDNLDKDGFTFNIKAKKIYEMRNLQCGFPVTTDRED